MSILKTILILLVFALMVLIVSFGSLRSLNEPPAEFPVGESIVIEQGASVRDISAQLKAAHVVRSELLLYGILTVFYDPTNIKASEYIFTEPLSMTAVASRLAKGDYSSDLVRITFIEGERASTYGEQASQVLESFDAEFFRAMAEQQEGKLYPETYFIPPTFTEADLLEHMTSAYHEVIASLQSQIDAHPLTEEEIVILASIVEREANSPESMRMVSGILQNRLAIDMPLQADASLEYVIDVPLHELPPGQLANELRELESPYNTYLNLGLPPTPIGNPGLEAITAVLEPTPSRYLYYITGDDGNFYYAETLAEHNQNIENYLR